MAVAEQCQRDQRCCHRGQHLNIHKHAGLCPTGDSGWHRCSEMPIPRAIPHHGEISALQHEALQARRAAAEGYLITGCWRLMKIGRNKGFGVFFPLKEATRFK